MDDTGLMKVIQSFNDLACKRACDLVLELAMPPQASSNGSTRYILQKAITGIVNDTDICSCQICLHAKKVGRLFKAQVLHNIWMIKIFQCLAFKF